MTIAYIDSVSAIANIDNDTATTAAIDTTGANFLIAVVADYPGSDPAVISDSKSNTWTEIHVDSQALRIKVYMATSPTVGSGHTFTASGVESYNAISVAAFSGVMAGADPTDGENSAGNFLATSGEPGSVTPTVNNDLLVVIGGTDLETLPYSIDDGFTMDEQNEPDLFASYGSLIAHKIQTSAGAENPTVTFNDTTYFNLYQVAIKAALATFKPRTTMIM